MLLEMVRSAISETQEGGKKGGRILIIDNDFSFVSGLEAKLRQAGYEVAFSATAEQGLEMAREAPPDIILLDFSTSHANGHTGIKSIGRDPSLQNTSIFILAPQSVIDRVDARTSALEKFIPKPVNYGLLLDTLQRTMRSKKGQV
jgi:DNA-binding response OmpR family regulator